ncbi:helix-turn-helix transcriptional regulator [Pararhizobium sp. O133]|uniref:helix-turn-helix transcriptional regulator n=1 Tax=Pararhizobium sp. O133 TaxID=3449278 RepID=UPI003F685708
MSGSVVSQALQLVDDALTATTPHDASVRFFRAASRMGATYLQTRLYRRPMARLTSEAHWAAGGVLARISPERWPGSTAFNYICFDCNPLVSAIRENRTRYRFSDFAPHEDPAYGAYWEALSEADIADAHCATSYGSRGVIASLHLGFGERNIGADMERAVQMGGLILTERLMDFSGSIKDDCPHLSDRERDCLAFLADGRRDREIADLLGITETTVRFHVDNARKKLGARNRTQAIARVANLRIL